MKNKNIYFIGLPIFIFILLSFLLYLYLFMPNYFPKNQLVEFQIKRGETLNIVANNLYDRKLIRSIDGFKIAGFITGSQSKIRAGIYVLHSGGTYFSILSKFTRGDENHQVSVTIPEGIWQPKLAQLLNSKLGIEANEFLQLSKNRKFLRSIGINAVTAEGYLLPNTYFFEGNCTAKDIIEKLKYENDKIFNSELVRNQMLKIKMTRHQVLTLASIIDGESNRISEFDTISAVYHNRLRKGIPLQADPTIQYLIRGKLPTNKIYYKYLSINSPYNTYKYVGLPPNPINNPGKEAIYAALFPAKVDYIYFVADGTGGHNFSKNYSQHQQKVDDYRKWRRTQQ